MVFLDWVKMGGETLVEPKTGWLLKTAQGKWNSGVWLLKTVKTIENSNDGDGGEESENSNKGYIALI